MIRRLDYRPHKNRLWDNSGGVEKLNLCGLARWRDYRANEAGFGVVSAAGDTSGQCGPACRWDYRASKADFGIQPTQTQPGYGAMRPGRGS